MFTFVLLICFLWFMNHPERIMCWQVIKTLCLFPFVQNVSYNHQRICMESHIIWANDVYTRVAVVCLHKLREKTSTWMMNLFTLALLLITKHCNGLQFCWSSISCILIIHNVILFNKSWKHIDSVLTKLRCLVLWVDISLRTLFARKMTNSIRQWGIIVSSLCSHTRTLHSCLSLIFKCGFRSGLTVGCHENI